MNKPQKAKKIIEQLVKTTPAEKAMTESKARLLAAALKFLGKPIPKSILRILGGPATMAGTMLFGDLAKPAGASPKEEKAQITRMKALKMMRGKK